MCLSVESALELTLLVDILRGGGGLKILVEGVFLKKAPHSYSPSLSHNIDHNFPLAHFTWPSPIRKKRETKKLALH